MRALTVLQCTTPFKRQHSASPVCHKACTGSLPRATMQPWPRLSPDVKSGGRRPGALCRCFPVWLNICLICWHPTCSALTPPSLPLPFSDSLSHNYWVDSPVLLSVSNLYICTQSQTVLCRRECGYSRPRGPRANPPIHCCSLHYQLYLSICPSVHHCLYPAAHLAFLLASLPHTHSSIAALLWVTFKDQAPLLINTKTAALYSMSVLYPLSSSLPLFQSQKCFTC